MYDLTKANVDLSANSSNHKAMFPEYSKNIPQIYVSKVFQGYPWNIARLQKCFHEVKKCKNCFVGYSVKFLILAGSLLSLSELY